MGSKYHYALSWPVAPLQLIHKLFSFRISLPEAFTLSLKCPPHLKVLSSASLLVSLSTSYTGKETFKGSTEDTCSSEKSLMRWHNISVASQHQMPPVS